MPMTSALSPDIARSISVMATIAWSVSSIALPNAELADDEKDDTRDPQRRDRQEEHRIRLARGRDVIGSERRGNRGGSVWKRKQHLCQYTDMTSVCLLSLTS